MNRTGATLRVSSPIRVAWWLGAALLFGGCAAAPVPPDRAPPASSVSPPRPSVSPPVEAKPAVETRSEPLVVAIVVDQFAAWLARERLPLLPPEGGFARLLREGTYVTDLRYAHATTDTAPGHAALFTGAPPSLTGVYANQRVDPKTGISASILSDPNSKLVSRAGVGTAASSSARVLRAESVSDRLRAQHPEALIVSLSLKDRGAIFGCGKHPSACLWFDGKLEDFVSSDAFSRSLPQWALDAPTTIRPSRVGSWLPLDYSWLQHAALLDATFGEGALAGQTHNFPHPIAGAEHAELAFSVSPYGDEAVIDLAVAAVQALPFGKQPGLLALSLSSTDYVGHIYGPDSWEWWDNFQRLDLELARLFKALDAKVGIGAYAVVLSADHGTGVLPETLDLAAARPWCNEGAGPDPFERPCTEGGRIALARLVPELEAVARRSVGPGKWVLGASNPYVYLTATALALPADKLTRLEQALSAALARKPGVEGIRLRPAHAEACPPASNDTLDALVCRSFSDDAGQLYVVTQPGWFLDAGYVPGFGANHGSHRLHDRSVPLLARAPGRIAQGHTVTTPQSFAVFARTLSALLGIEAPEHAYPAPTALELR